MSSVKRKNSIFHILYFFFQIFIAINLKALKEALKALETLKTGGDKKAEKAQEDVSKNLV